ncbi:MAG: hypothetical protein ABJK28_01980 [Algibacter sp.]
MQKKTLFLIPDGVGVRNYLYSDLIKFLKERSKLIFWSTLPKVAFLEVFEAHSCRAEVVQIKLEKESFFTRIFKESATYARLISNAKKVNNRTILSNWNNNPKGAKRKILNVISKIIGKWGSYKYSRILYLEEQSKKKWKRSLIEKYKLELTKSKPQVIFITHQRVSGLMPICIAAKELNIKIVCAIYSWDNLPKARLAIIADQYVVWSDLMKEDMRLFYPEISQEKVLVTGTPQFEFYLQKERIVSREVFAKKYNLDSNKRWICFSGDDVKTSPYDADFLRDVAEANEFIPKADRAQIIFRRCPVDFSDRYNDVIETYNFIISIDPIWHVPGPNENWGAYFPKMDDIALQANLATHCDFVVNMGSTMAHDFSVFNKPCFYLNYNPVEDEKWTVKDIYNYQHFRSMKTLDAVGWFNSNEEIKNKMQKALKKTNSIGIDKKEWFKKINLHPIDMNSKYISDVLLNSN